MSLNNRREGLDILKCIGAFLIVCIHAPFPGAVGEYVTAIARAGVPIFLMISGFFYNNLIQKNRTIAQIKKIFLLTISANALFFLYYFSVSLIKGNSAEYLGTAFSLKNILKFVFLNDSPFEFHLWYLGSLLYVLLIIEFIRRAIPFWKRILYIISPFLLLGDLILGKYSILIWGHELLSYVFVRNFLFVGIPYFSIGLYLSDHRDKLEEWSSCNICNIIITAVFILTTVLERYMLVAFNLNAKRDQYISTTFLAVALFVLFSNISWNDRKIPLLKNIGKNYSLIIYIIHPLLIDVLQAVFSKIHILKAYSFIAPIIIFIASIVTAIVYIKIKNAIKQLIKK